MAGGPMQFAVSTETQIGGAVTLPPDRYTGTVSWRETMKRGGFERSKKSYRIELDPEDVLRWGGDPGAGESPCVIDITEDVASGAIKAL
ncbi:hypothetical protein GGR04_003324 [Aureimonas pseudogalii]|uniref:Uncharacterized protein n=3 Tax=Aureimonas pseudogalii TaxID=1744844 RepID=A0A7W6H6G7_9HYPH|nr:hypothetical protein [Aureimonas pseudogalii]